MFLSEYMQTVDRLEAQLEGTLCAVFEDNFGFYEYDGASKASWFFEDDSIHTGFWLNNQKGSVIHGVWHSEDDTIVVGVDTALEDLALIE